LAKQLFVRSKLIRSRNIIDSAEPITVLIQLVNGMNYHMRCEEINAARKQPAIRAPKNRRGI
jgi:hypothetical protein